MKKIKNFSGEELQSIKLLPANQITVNFKLRENIMKKISLIALDLDGTLLGPQINTIDPLAKSALEKIHENKIKIVIASGRSYQAILEIFKINSIDIKNGYPQAIVTNGEIFILKKNIYSPLPEWNREIKISLFNVLPTIKELNLIILPELEMDYTFEKINECLLNFCNAEQAIAARKFINEKIKQAGYRNIFARRNTTLVGIEPKNISKGRSLNKLVKLMDLPASAVLAVGDSQNDEDMLDGKYGFNSATVSNGETEIKNLVKKNKGYIADLPLGQGVAEILNALALKEEIHESCPPLLPIIN